MPANLTRRNLTLRIINKRPISWILTLTKLAQLYFLGLLLRLILCFLISEQDLDLLYKGSHPRHIAAALLLSVSGLFLLVYLALKGLQQVLYLVVIGFMLLL
uniref:Uncharacterized protein n=1 Tax=Strombidium inclinatum TaxID=197538 RepID=A0A7S3N4N5_9SPIT|mmetsp:Transcript_5629/g.8887  ORF Transcript_5629/g.8887 Transcript_5629/m.8887 type:complete len:102 (+) Transcript_5629:2635-2940(+)